MQDKTSNHAPIPTELNIAPRGKSWLHGALIDGEHGHPTRQSMEKAESAQPNKAPAAVAVVLPEHDAAIREVLALVNQAVRIGQEAARHDFHIRPTDSVNSLKRLDSAMLTIETKLRALLAGVSVPMVPPEWEKVRRGLTMVMLGFAGRPDCSESAAEAALDAVTEPGMPLACLRAALLAGVSAPAAQAVASIYVTADGQRECDDWKMPLPIGRNLLYTAPQMPADAQDALTDSALLDAMEQKRIAVVPEYEGPWDAEIYNDDGTPNHRGSGSTPREAIRAAIAAAQQTQGGGDATD